MESWRMVWREGFAPEFSTAGLEALWHALRSDDPRLMQGASTSPPPLSCHHDDAINGCCSIGWCGFQGENLETVGEVEEYFARACFEADQRLGEAGASRWFLNWYDDAPRTAMRLELQAEVERILDQRFGQAIANRAASARRRARVRVKSVAAA